MSRVHREGYRELGELGKIGDVEFDIEDRPFPIGHFRDPVSVQPGRPFPVSGSRPRDRGSAMAIAVDGEMDVDVACQVVLPCLLPGSPGSPFTNPPPPRSLQ